MDNSGCLTSPPVTVPFSFPLTEVVVVIVVVILFVLRSVVSALLPLIASCGWLVPAGTPEWSSLGKRFLRTFRDGKFIDAIEHFLIRSMLAQKIDETDHRIFIRTVEERASKHRMFFKIFAEEQFFAPRTG